MLPCAFIPCAAGILHSPSDLKRMLSYVNEGQAGFPSNQYNDYLLLAKDHLSADTYRMSAPVVTLTQRSAFERDGAAAYQNALVSCFRTTWSHFMSILLMDFTDVVFDRNPISCKQGHCNHGLLVQHNSKRRPQL